MTCRHRNRRTILLQFLLASLLAPVWGGQSQGPVYKLLYSANPLTPGGFPTTMFEVEPGLFYGLSGSYGGSPAAIFSLTSAGTFKLIYTFPATNNNQVLSLVQATNGRLYGAGFSASGNYYISISTTGNDLQQYPFPGQWGPFGGTIVAPAGELYDIAGTFVGNNEVYGVARIEEAGQITILHQFSPFQGAPNPYSNIVDGPDGSIYGIGNQSHGGVSPAFIYRVTPAGAYSQLLNFDAYGGSFTNPLIAASNGNLYGSFEGGFRSGGPNTSGAIYQATLSGQVQIIAHFPSQGMVEPVSLMQAADGNFYGSTNTNSYIFRYNLATNTLSQIYHLPVATCYCELIEGMDGKLYGVGRNSTIFSLNLGLPKPAPIVSGLYPSSGMIGQKVTLWGNYLLGASSVNFNGVPAASVLATSVRSVQVTVPAGATTGPITLTTSNGSFTTTQNFTVE